MMLIQYFSKKLYSVTPRVLQLVDFVSEINIVRYIHIVGHLDCSDVRVACSKRPPLHLWPLRPK